MSDFQIERVQGQLQLFASSRCFGAYASQIQPDRLTRFLPLEPV